MIPETLHKRFYGDPKYDGTIAFYDWIREVARPSHRVLNLGAGPATNTPKRRINDAVSEVIGADVDPIVLENKEIDRGYVMHAGRVPVKDSYFDLVYSDFVLEHVDQPEHFLREVHRLLKPGGSFFFRTPNLHHYVALISRLTPHFFHKLVANRVRGLSSDAHEPWRTHYRMNTRSTLTTLAKKTEFNAYELRLIECEPSYLMFNVVPFLAGLAYERTVNSTPNLEGFRACILGRFQKLP